MIKRQDTYILSTRANFRPVNKKMVLILLYGKNNTTIGSFWDDREESAYPQELRDAWAAEMKETRAKQEIERAEWQELLKSGYKLDMNNNRYKVGEE